LWPRLSKLEVHRCVVDGLWSGQSEVGWVKAWVVRIFGNEGF